LKGINFPTAYPIARDNGKYITKLPVGFVVLYDFIQGQHPDLGIAPAHSIGEALGKLSIFKPSEDLKRANAINIDGCILLADALDDAANPLPDIFKYFKNQTEFFKTRVDIGVPKGLIHADVFPDNTIFDGENLRAIIDFEEACWDELLFDLSMAINGFCFPNNELSYSFLESILNGYLMHRKLTREEWEALPIYIAWTAHGMLSWHLERLSQTPSQRQEQRVRELMSRVVDILDREESLSHSIRKIRETTI
jgi:homoserine kinase type II